MNHLPQFAHCHEVPLQADSVASPIVHYGEPMTAIHFFTEDGRWGRVTFERLDSLRVSRGEYDPFPESPDNPEGFHWVMTISNSTWLRERYEYEKQHYGTGYKFCGNVDEMLEEYFHYVFSFHDEFVEAIAAGIWLEAADVMLCDEEINTSHPLKGLAHLEPVEHFESSGIRCFVRRNPKSNDELDARRRIVPRLSSRSVQNWMVDRRVVGL